MSSTHGDDLFRLLDTGAGGTLGTFKRKLKFKIRLAWYQKELAKFEEYLRQRQLLGLVDIDPALYVKCIRAYLWTGLNGHQRLQAQVGFFDWLLANTSAEEIYRFYKVGHRTVCQLSVNHRVVEVRLMPARGLGREGELALWLSVDGAYLMRAAFSVLPDAFVNGVGSDHVMVVGAVKNSKNSAELIRDVTKLLERTKPSVFLFSALQVLAEAWNLNSIFGVSDSTHVFSAYHGTLAKRVQRQYDAFWKELGAEAQTTRGLWILPLTWNPRSEEGVDSKRRSQHRRRMVLRGEFVENCRKNMGLRIF